MKWFTKATVSDIILSNEPEKAAAGEAFSRNASPVFKYTFLYMKVISLKAGDILTLKKPHPCGASEFRVTRIGSDIGVCCCGCSREMMIPRVKLERSIKRVNGQPIELLVTTTVKRTEI